MPRFRIATTDFDDDFADSYDDFEAAFDKPQTLRRRRPTSTGPRLALEGRSGRVEVEVDGSDDDSASDAAFGADDPDESRFSASDRTRDAELPYSSYDVAVHGPGPVPDWVVTALSARDTRLGNLKSGKEADVSLLERTVPGGQSCLLAVKTYRSAEHRMFHRDSGYQEGRRVRRTREGRAMASRSAFGRELLAGQWAVAEFNALSALWSAGARVPYPVQLIGSELMMQFVGTPDGVAAPRLAAFDADTATFTDLWHDLVSTLEVLAEAGYTHGDLSPYNILVDDGGCVVIDLPQVVDLIANPQGQTFLDRDCKVVAEFFARRGVSEADGPLLATRLASLALG